MSTSNQSPTLTTPELSIVMPVYNEAAVLADVLTEALETLNRCGRSHELVLLDDASTDDSFAILQEFQGRHPQTVRVLRNESNLGIIGTCERLYASAKGRFVFVNSSDGQWKCAEVLPMLALAEHYDIVIGRRRRKNYGLVRQVISGMFNLLPRLLFGVETYDAGSIKLFRRELLAIPLISRSPFREAERVIRAHRLGYRIGAVDVEHHDRRGGKATGARWQLVVQSLLDLGRLRWQLTTPHPASRAPAFPV
jgi:glycosyltransferase involved in cell wall biosynthesis